MDAPLEVPVPREHRRRDEVPFLHGCGDVAGERARVSDARGAAVADDVEAELLEIRDEPRLPEVARDDLRAGGEAGLDPRLHREPGLDRLLCEQPRAEHHRRVAGVGARGDRCDDDRAMADPRGRLTRKLHLRRRHGCLFVEREAALLDRGLHRHPPRIPRARKRDPVLRAPGSREARHDRAEVERERVAEDRVGSLVRAEEPLRAAVFLDEVDERRGAAGEEEVLERPVVDRKEAGRGAVLGGHVRNGGAVGDRHRREPRAVELDELPDDPLLSQHLRHGQHEVGRGDPLVQPPNDLETDDRRREHGERLAEHRRLGLDPADAPPEHAGAVGHRGVRVGADERIGERDAVARLDDLREVLEVHLVADPARRRDDAEVAERLLPPVQELVAFAVARELLRGVGVKRAVRGVLVDLHAVVDDEVDRDDRVDPLGVAAQARERRPHRRQVDHARDAGEVLQKHAGGLERDLEPAGVFRVVFRERGDVVARHLEAVFGAEQGLEQHLDRERQPRDRRDPVLLELREPEDADPALRGCERRACSKRIACRRHMILPGNGPCNMRPG